MVDNITTERGAHSLKFGADFLYNRVNITFPGALQGAYTFSSLANLQAGRYVTFQQAFGEPSLFQSNPNIGFFAQDEWRARPDLTINVGFRYDLQFLPDPIKTDTNNIAPRLGLAYAPGDRKTVIRASYGIYYDRIPLRATSNALQRDGTKYKVASFSVRPTRRSGLSERGRGVPARLPAEHHDDRSEHRERLHATGKPADRTRIVLEHLVLGRAICTRGGCT